MRPGHGRGRQVQVMPEVGRAGHGKPVQRPPSPISNGRSVQKAASPDVYGGPCQTGVKSCMPSPPCYVI